MRILEVCNVDKLFNLFIYFGFRDNFFFDNLLKGYKYFEILVEKFNNVLEN